MAASQGTTLGWCGVTMASRVFPAANSSALRESCRVCVFLSVYLSINLCLPVSVCPSTCLFIYLPICLFVYPPTISLSVYLSIFLITHLSICCISYTYSLTFLSSFAFFGFSSCYLSVPSHVIPFHEFPPLHKSLADLYFSLLLSNPVFLLSLVYLL